MTLENLLLKVEDYNMVVVVDEGDEITATCDMLSRSLRPQLFTRQVDAICTGHAGALVIKLTDEEDQDDDSPDFL